jgi:hypothetical protein
MHQEHSAAVVRGSGNDGSSGGFPFLIPH